MVSLVLVCSVRRWFWSFRGCGGFVGLSLFGSRLVLVLVGPRLRWFRYSQFVWCAFGVGFGRCGGFVGLGFWVAFGVGSSRCAEAGAKNWGAKKLGGEKSTFRDYLKKSRFFIFKAHLTTSKPI